MKRKHLKNLDLIKSKIIQMKINKNKDTQPTVY